MTRILVTGIRGQVGWELLRALQPLGEVIGCDRTALDLAQPDSLRAALCAHRPDIIVNPAAYTAVDQAEREPERAMAINATAPAVLAEEAKRLGALFVHYSTDYVFDGAKADAYREDDPTGPLNVYGASKLAGEEAIRASGCRHLIFRLSWVYGLRGKNFLLTMLRLAHERDELAVVADQFGAPTWCRMIAETTALALSRHRDQEGIYHLTASGMTSWHGFAERIIARAFERGLIEKRPPVRRLSSADYPTAARRPANSRLDGRRLREDFGLEPVAWETQLELCLDAACRP